MSEGNMRKAKKLKEVNAMDGSVENQKLEVLLAELGILRKHLIRSALILLLAMVLAAAYFVLFIVYVSRGFNRNTVIVEGKDSTIWSYIGNTAPFYWNTLPDGELYVLGGGVEWRTGRTKNPYAAPALKDDLQSPIDISPFISPNYKRAETNATTTLANLFQFEPTVTVIVMAHRNNITYYQCDQETPCGMLTLNEEDPGGILVEMNYTLNEVHIHSPAETTIYSDSRAMEVQFFYGSSEQTMAILSALFNAPSGGDNAAIETLIQGSAAYIDRLKANETNIVERRNVDLRKLVNLESAFYRWNGSLSIPPCTKGIQWFTQENSGTISEYQRQFWYDMVGYPGNSRPVQELEGRSIEYSIAGDPKPTDEPTESEIPIARLSTGTEVNQAASEL